MIFRDIFIFLTIFSLQNGVKSNNSQEVLFEMTDMKSIEKLIMENYDISYINNQSFEKLTVEEKNKIIGNTLLAMKEFIIGLRPMESPDKDFNPFSWKKDVLEGTLPTRAFLYDLNNFYDQLKSLDYSIKLSVNQLQSSYKYYPFFGLEKVSNCLHSWAIKSYSSRYDLHLSNIKKMHKGYSDLIKFISAEEKSENNVYDYCKYSTSFRQDLYNAYRQFIIVSFDKFSINYFAALEQEVCSNLTAKYRDALLQDKAELQDSSKKILEMIKPILHNQIHYTYLCNPEGWEKNKEDTHLELGRLAQTIVIAEKDLSTTQSCSHNCNLDSIKDTINRKECSEFRDCQYIMDTYWITEAKNNSRRYKCFSGFNSHNIQLPTQYYGYRPHTWIESEKSLKLFSKYDWGRVRYCDYCICTCATKPSRSSYIVTAISFRNQVSNVNDNMAVVGFKFVKKDYMIHIQILEGQVLPHGKIGNESWKSLEKFDYNETTEKYYVLNDNNDSIIPLELGVDYGHPDIMNLNDVMAPEKHVITGVRFRFAGDSLDSPKRKQGPIELQIRVTPFDFVKGKIINVNESLWVSPKEQDLKDELVLENPDNPFNAPSNIDPIITSSKFIKFRPSDLKKDAGQTTVPFFDGREMKFRYSSLLGGVGLIHRGHVGFGGYLATKIFDFDMSPYINTIIDLNDHHSY